MPVKMIGTAELKIACVTSIFFKGTQSHLKRGMGLIFSLDSTLFRKVLKKSNSTNLFQNLRSTKSIDGTQVKKLKIEPE